MWISKFAPLRLALSPRKPRLALVHEGAATYRRRFGISVTRRLRRRITLSLVLLYGGPSALSARIIIRIKLITG
jgi:hypothetical protein